MSIAGCSAGIVPLKFLLVRSRECKHTLPMNLNDAFWCRVREARFRSHLKIRRHPKYEVIGDKFGGATLTIVFHDFDKRPKHINFDSIEDALLNAERYETESSSS